MPTDGTASTIPANALVPPSSPGARPRYLAPCSEERYDGKHVPVSVRPPNSVRPSVSTRPLARFRPSVSIRPFVVVRASMRSLRSAF